MSKQRNLRRFSFITAALLCVHLTAHAQTPAGRSAPTGLTSEFIYKYLVGEIAGQRGDVALAGSLFYDLAKSSRDPRLAERAARAAAYGNQTQLAIRAANLWAELDPESLEAQQASTQLLLNSGKLNEALPHLKKLLAQEETRASGFLYLNGVLSHAKDKAAALKVAQELAKTYPDLAEARFTVAHCAWAAGKDPLALSELKAAEELRPGWELAALLGGEIRLRKSPADAIDFYRDFVAQYPESNDVRLAYARLLVNLKRYDQARGEFGYLIENARDNAEVPVIAGLLSVQLNDYAEADRYFQLALERGFKEPEQLYLYLGQSAEQQNRPDQALGWYQRVGAGERFFEAQLHIAALIARQGKLDEARRLLHNLPDLTSEQAAVAMQAEANLLIRSGNFQEAYTILEKAVSTLPNTPEILYDYAMAAERLERFEVMEKQLRTIMQLKPDFAQAYNALGYALAERNVRLHEASTLIEKALSLSPDDHYILDSMGWVQYRLGKLDKAADYLRRAYTVQNDPEIAAHLGEVLWQQGRREEAIQTWEKALREFPDSEPLRNTSKKFHP